MNLQFSPLTHIFNGNPSPWGRQCSTGSNSSWWIWTPPFWPGKVAIWQTEVSQAAMDLHWWSPSNWHPQQPSLSKGPRGYWHALSRTDDSLDPWKQPSQSSSKPHINKDLCHLKQPHLSKCERFGHELHEPIKKFINILSTPISILPKKNITTFQCSKGSVSHVARFVKRTFNSSTMRAFITCIGYHFQLHGISPCRRRKHPYLEGKAATILVELVAEDHQDAHREEQWNQRNLCEWKMRQAKEINRNWARNWWGKKFERSLLGFVAHVLQLWIKLRSHDDWIAKEHLPNSLTPRIVPGCLWHHHTVNQPWPSPEAPGLSTRLVTGFTRLTSSFCISQWDPGPRGRCS